MQLLKSQRRDDIEKIYITASGGPFLNRELNKFKKIKPHDAIKHPQMEDGKKSEYRLSDFNEQNFRNY